MDLTDLTSSTCVFADMRARSKKALFQEVSQKLAGEFGVDARTLFCALLEREKLGSTSMGRGVAIPHCRLSAMKTIQGALVRLETPIDFDSVDGEPVDLFFFLIGPETSSSAHLLALARVSRSFKDEAVVKRLRGAADSEALYAALNELDHAA